MLGLRRFSFGVTDTVSEDHYACDAAEPDERGYRQGCNASADLDVELPLAWDTHDDGWRSLPAVPTEYHPPRDDPLWPTKCDKCGKPFPDGAQWQVNQREVYRRSDNGERVAIRGHADQEFAGALFDAWWYHGRNQGDFVGPDGIALVAVCPDGTNWTVDGPATGGGHWARTGDPRQPETLNVNPSIQTGRYHGWLHDGAFTDDLGS